jgi:trans-aconitate methyltransferase
MNDKSYTWNASDYANHSSAQFEWAKELIGKLRLLGDEAVLDVGCGDGKVTALIAEHLPNGSAAGIDSSPDMVGLAGKNHPAPKHPNLTFLQMDARRISFDRLFDVVFSNAALHWVKEQDAVLAGVRASLKEGGRLLFQMGGKGNAGEALAVIDRLATRTPWREHLEDFPFPWTFPDVEEYGRLLAQTGFRPMRIELVAKDMVQKGREGLAGWIRTTWLPYIERIPNQLRESFISEILDEYLAESPLDAGGFAHVRMVRLEVEATAGDRKQP